MVTSRGWMLTVALAVGCGCPRFGDMVVTNPEHLATVPDLYQFSKAIADFERWSGWNSVCVPELQVRGELREGRVVGLYQGPHQPILLAAGSGHSTAIHEMCHAADQQLGWISDNHPDIYPVTHIDPLTYTSRSSQVHESFARACEAGPNGLSLMRALEDRCGIPLEHPGYTMVLEQVYEGIQVARKPATLRTLALDDFGIDSLIGDGTLLDVASGGRLIWLVVRDPDPILEEGNPTDHLTRQVWRIIGWSPATQQVEQVHTLLRRPPSLAQGARTFHLLDSVDDPVLVESTAAAPIHLWLLDEAAGVLERLPDQPHIGGSADVELGLAGVMQDGVALLRVDNPPEEVPGALQVPVPSSSNTLMMLGMGWVAADAWSGDRIDDHHVYNGPFQTHLQNAGVTLTATADGTLAVGVEAAVVPYWPYQAKVVDADGEAEELRSTAAGLSNPMGIDPDGRVLALWSNTEVWHTIDQRRFLVLHDPGSGAYWVPDDACTPKEDSVAVDRVMHVDGELWLLATVLGSNRRVLRRVVAE